MKQIKLIVFFIFLFSSCVLSSQSVDTLYRLFKNADYFNVIKIGNKETITDNPEIYYILGVSYQYINKSKEAERNFQNAFMLDTVNTKYINSLAYSASENSNFRKAKTLYRKALKNDSLNFTALNYLSKIYINENNFKEAIKIYKTLLRQDSLNPYYYRRIAYCFTKSGDEETGIKYFRKAFKTDTTDIESIKSLALIYYKNKIFDCAVKYCDIGISTDSMNADFYRIKANAFFAERLYSSAIPLYKKALSLGDTSYNISKRLGMILCDNEQFEDALIYNLAVYETDTSSYSNTLYLSRNYLGLGKFDKSIEFAEKTLENVRFAKRIEFDVYDIMARNYTKEKDYINAVKMYDNKYQVLNIRYLSDYYNIALLYDKLGNKRKAIEFYEKVIEKKKEYLKPDEKDEIYQYSEYRITRLLEDLHFEGN